MRQPDWDKDLADGTYAEDIVEDVFRELIPVEVKHDRYALEGTAQGRNVFVETHCRNSSTGEYYESGISKTKADAYIYMLSCRKREYVGIIIGVDRLRALMQGKRVIPGGLRGGNPTRGVLVPTYELVMSANGDRS